MAKTPTAAPASSGTAPERIPVPQPEGVERTRNRPIYGPRVGIIETEDALEILADMAPPRAPYASEVLDGPTPAPTDTDREEQSCPDRDPDVLDHDEPGAPEA